MTRGVARRECPGCRHSLSVRPNGQLVRHGCDGTRMGPPVATPYERVMRNVRRTRGGHALWRGYLTNGVPMMRTGPRKPNGARERNESCRRIVWEHEHGPLPKHAPVLVACGRGDCLAIGHLRRPGAGETRA